MSENHRYKIQLDTLTDVKKFLDIVTKEYSKPNDCLYLTNETGDYTVNAKSMMGIIYSLEWNNLFLISNKEVYNSFKDFII